MKLFGVRGLLVKASVFFVGLLVLTCAWLRFSGFPPPALYALPVLTAAALLLLLALNLIAIRRAKPSFAHTVIAGVIPLAMLVAFIVVPKVIPNAQRNWFLTRGIRKYELIVEKAIKGRNLEATMRPLPPTISPYRGYGRTNSDGSVMIEFPGHGNYPRGGYLYYSGTQMIPKLGASGQCGFPGNPDRVYFHLTNNWYEY